MENFIVSARKYRPLTFDTVVGQEAITSTLKNAIRNRHLAQAYLFCGPRGVGKTTCARIFAKTINCKNINDKTEPCNECESCKAFEEARSYNIHELDAASNNSVDDIRNLNEQVRIPPQIGKYSTYIIDEVHMLSASAFNAFLKTLEEPPSHAVFILATTEKQKIIPTILSRCQIFDFNRISVPDMVDYMIYIAGREKIEAEPDALNVIARKADGAMRDALSIFDQIVSFSGNRITYKEVIENLNILDFDYYFRITEAFLENNHVESLMIFNDVIENGFDGHHFMTGLSSHIRDLLVCKDSETVQLLEVGASIRENYLRQSAGCTTDFLYKALEICSFTDIYYKSSNNQRLHVELALIKLCRLTGDLSENTGSVETQQDELSEKSEPSGKDEPDSAKTGETAYEKTERTEPETRKENTIKPSGNEKSSEDSKVHEEIPESSGETGKDTYQSSTTSIRNALNGLSEDSDKDYESGNPTDPEIQRDIAEINDFDEQTLIEKWHLFADSIKSLKPRLSTTLKTQLPALLEKYRIEVEMNNGAQKDDFDRVVKPDLTEFLRNELHNREIQIFSFVAKEEDNSNSLYTDEEKFKYLNQVNPNLGKLKQQFNLDFD
ncbi:MAG: DNA polymerase III subunit gamma/tau [Bacteroidales bacterium]|nr:MAG: DNA polymerase III subunit gamma/tau [Bacteroidales bacterium]